ncbi:unnamed protein product, partial [Mesorhabditis belari]|uniref:C-type lectin domain-containing protein n=1 Tax=Mesorhabditis belari TaxID=2138241 RepID=A0AAF3EJ40_9BILA
MLLTLLFFSIFLFGKAFCDTCLDVHCPAKWAYLAKTKSCYFVQDFTYPDAENWQLYNWTTAELNCKRMGAHLVSIHSVEEDNFVYELILSRVGRYLNDQPCYNDLAAWIGYFGSGIVGTGNWTDGTPVDYIGRTPWTPWVVGAKMLNDPTCHFHQWAWSQVEEKLSRYVCKKAATG